MTKLRQPIVYPVALRGDLHLTGASSNYYLIEDWYTGETNYLLDANGHIFETRDGWDFSVSLQTLIDPIRPYTHPLTWGIFRTRGMREAERVAEWVHPLTIAEKLPIIQYLQLNTSPMMILGIAYSNVQTQVTIGATEWVTRSLGMVEALSEPCKVGQHTFDYVVHDYALFHAVNDENITPSKIGGVSLICPRDAMVFDGKLHVWDAGDSNYDARIIVCEIG